MQQGLQCDLVALQRAYPQRRLAIGTAQQIHTDGSGQTSGEDSSVRFGAVVYDACSGREITIDPCRDGTFAHSPLCGARRHPSWAAALRGQRGRQDPY